MAKRFHSYLKNKGALILLVGLCVMFLTSCDAFKENQIDNDEENISQSSDLEEKEMQRDFQEHLIATFNLTLDDLDKVDMKRFEKGYGQRRDAINNDNVFDIINLFRSDYDMHYLLNNVAEPMFKTFPLLEDIRYIYLFENIGSRFKTAIFDFENSQVTYDENGDVGYYYTTSPKKEFTQTEQELLVDILSNGTSEWDTSNSGTNGDTTGHHTWRLIIQLESHEIYRYSGYGIMGGKPENFDEIVNSIWKLINK